MNKSYFYFIDAIAKAYDGYFKLDQVNNGR